MNPISTPILTPSMHDVRSTSVRSSASPLQNVGDVPVLVQSNAPPISTLTNITQQRMAGFSPGKIIYLIFFTSLVVDLTTEPTDNTSSDVFTSSSEEDRADFTVPIPDDDEIEEWSLRRRKRYADKVIKGVRSIQSNSSDESEEDLQSNASLDEFENGKEFFIYFCL
jgi:hypothetical protein